MTNNESAEPVRFFECKICNYYTLRKSQYKRHITTTKHLQHNDPCVILPQMEIFQCECGKKYKYNSGLSRHKKKCKWTDPKNPEMENTELTVHQGITNTDIVPKNMNNEFICDLLREISISNKQNAEFKQIIMEQQTKMIEMSKSQTTQNITNTNSNNTQINISMFLNEYCKDAMTIDDFIKSIEISMDDIMYMAKNGNKEGLLCIIMKSLNQLQITERPLHCTDIKRHTTYFKEPTGWNKENDQKNLKRLCNKTEHACIVKSMDIIHEHPQYTKNGTQEYETAIKMMTETNGGHAGSEYNHNLVIKSLEEKIHLDKPLMIDVISEKTT